MIIRDATSADATAICEIYNDAVVNTTAIWSDTRVDPDNRRTWIHDRFKQNYPVLVAVLNDMVIGYASFGDWRAWDGYRQTVEHSVYIHADQRGNGVGRELMLELIKRGKQAGKHVMIAGIEAGNVRSVRLHEKLGFEHAGLLRQVGMKFGTWLDLVFLQLTLDAKPSPELQPKT